MLKLAVRKITTGPLNVDIHKYNATQKKVTGHYERHCKKHIQANTKLIYIRLSFTE
jgi:hypothetical protein